ncbi:hypothetical protein [Nocardia sp. NBC_01327]|uniref:hypothetical protein n=1 Tax=Nocardia sp. NBC_01327 TaxID=2903593 RepID=UPI002E1234E0|nr:hypothetical protein OG326_26400 [Nocardia sp. NBC_01327]
MRSYANDDLRFRGRSRSAISSVVTLVLFVWLIVGAVAAGQRHYYDNAPSNCASTGTIAVTIIAGPLNYLGANPKVDSCHVDVPQPSQ